MEESSGVTAACARKLPEKWEELSQQQKDIYDFLAENGPQKALPIAKAMKKLRAKDVNPDLYKMMGLEVLRRDGDKLWTIRAQSGVTEPVLKAKHLNRTEPQEASFLTSQQNDIFTFLKNNSKPLKAADIAKGVGRMSAKDVNPDLYLMERMGHLAKQGYLWMVKTDTSTSCDKDNVKYEQRRKSCPVSDNNHISSDLAQSDDNTQTYNNLHYNYCGKDPAACEYVAVDGQWVSQALPGDVTTPAQPDESTAPPCYAGNMVNKSYNIYIQNSQNVSVGDTIRFIDDQRILASSCVTGPNTQSYTCVYSVTQTATASLMPNASDGCPETALMGTSRDSGVGDLSAQTEVSYLQDATQEEESQPDWEDSRIPHAEDRLLGSPDRSQTYGLQRQPPKTSSPIVSDHVTPNLNISDLTYGFDQVKLDKSDGRDTIANSDDIVL